MLNIKVKVDQSLLDIALQEYGDIRGARWIVEDNENINTITDNVFEGETLVIRTEKINGRMQKYLSEFELQTVKGARGSGIEYMALERDFIVG